MTGGKTAVDFAAFLRTLSDTHFPKADRIVRVCGNLNTRTPASRYAAFAPAEARRRAERFEWHDTPSTGAGRTSRGWS